MICSNYTYCSIILLTNGTGINGTEMLRLVLTQGVRPPRERKARFNRASMRMKRVARAMQPDPKELERQRQEQREKKKKMDAKKAAEEDEDVATFIRRQTVVATSIQKLMKDGSKKKEAEAFLATAKKRRKSLAIVVPASFGGMAAAARAQKMRSDRAAKHAAGEMAVLW